MTRSFGAKSTTDDVLRGVDLRGERILVTGVSAGLGVQTARALAAHGGAVVGAARDLDKARRATGEIPTQAAAAGGSLVLAPGVIQTEPMRHLTTEIKEAMTARISAQRAAAGEPPMRTVPSTL